MKDNETKLRFVELRAQGKSYQTIADEIGVSKQTLINWSKDIEMKAQIAALAALEFDCLRETYRLMKNSRVEFLAKYIREAIDELERRSFQSVSTIHMLQILFRCDDRLLKEETAPDVQPVQQPPKSTTKTLVEKKAKS